MKRLTPIQPYSDNKLVWNENTNQYELTFEFCKEEYEQNFVDDDVLKQRIKKNSRNVYRFIYSRINQNNRPVVDVLLTRSKEGREFIFELLRTQFESDNDSGYNDLTNVSPINVSNGQVLPREEIYRNRVSVATEEVWDNSSYYFGFNIGYQAMFPNYYLLMARGLR